MFYDEDFNCESSSYVPFYSYFLILFIDFLESERKGEGEREKHRFVVPLIYPFIG